MIRSQQVQNIQKVRVRRSKRSKIVAGIVCFVLVFVVAFFGVQFVTKTGLFKVPGKVVVDDTLTVDEKELVEGLFREVTLDTDVVVTAENTLVQPKLDAGMFVTNILVAVTDFYDSKTNVDFADADAIWTEWLAEDGASGAGYELISFGELNYKRKLLRINGKYYLDDFTEGAMMRVLKFQSEKYEQEVAEVVKTLPHLELIQKDEVLTLAQTGVTAFSRLMNAKMNEVESGAYFAENLAERLSSYDLTHTSNEASFVDAPSSSGATGTPICSDRRFVDTLTAIGLDIVELTGNHNLDCGVAAAEETIDIYHERNIKTYGGGKNAAEAAVPLEITEKENRVTLLAFNESTGGATEGDYPGANQYSEERAAAQIKAAKDRGDLVIVDVQYFECSMYVDTGEDTTCDFADSAPGDQIGVFRHLIELGADVVVGTSAHQPQTYEIYGDGVIFYGLGNLFFDQAKWPGTSRSLVLVHHIYNNKLLQTEILPTRYDESFQTRFLDAEEAGAFLGRLASERPEA